MPDISLLCHAVKPTETHLFQWAGHPAVMLSDGAPIENTPSLCKAGENVETFFEIEPDALYSVAWARLANQADQTTEPDDEDVEELLAPIAEATAAKLLTAYTSFDALLAYAQAEEGKRALEALDYGYYEDLAETEKRRLWWETLDRLFPNIAATCPPVTVEEMIAHDELDTEEDSASIERLKALTPAELRDERWRFECYEDWETPDSEHVDYKLAHHLLQLRHAAMSAAGVTVEALPIEQPEGK